MSARRHSGLEQAEDGLGRDEASDPARSPSASRCRRWATRSASGVDHEERRRRRRSPPGRPARRRRTDRGCRRCARSKRGVVPVAGEQSVARRCPGGAGSPCADSGRRPRTRSPRARRRTTPWRPPWSASCPSACSFASEPTGTRSSLTSPTYAPHLGFDKAFLSNPSERQRAEQVLGDVGDLDLVGAGVDLEHLGVAGELLDLELGHVAVAAVELHRLQRHLDRGPGASRASSPTPRPGSGPRRPPPSRCSGTRGSAR